MTHRDVRATLAGSQVAIVSADDTSAQRVAFELQRLGCCTWRIPHTNDAGLAVARRAPEVCILEVGPREAEAGIDLIREFARADKPPAVVAVVQQPFLPEWVQLYRKAGAEDVIPAGQATQDLPDAVRGAVTRSRRFAAREAEFGTQPCDCSGSADSGEAYDCFTEVIETLRTEYRLSPKLVYIAALAMLGYQDKEIAQTAGAYSVACVKKHMRTLCQRLGVSTRYGLWRAYLDAKGVDFTTLLQRYELRDGGSDLSLLQKRMHARTSA